MSIGLIVRFVLVLMLLGVLPTWCHSRNRGCGPGGGLGLYRVPQAQPEVRRVAQHTEAHAETPASVFWEARLRRAQPRKGE